MVARESEWTIALQQLAAGVSLCLRFRGTASAFLVPWLMSRGLSKSLLMVIVMVCTALHLLQPAAGTSTKPTF
jgi:hypothetical protein